jgi:hypothetical protein
MGMSHLEAAFWRFHADNPAVYLLFDKFAHQIIAAGFQRYSADAVIHRIRWHTNIVARNPVLRISNNHASYYARLWMANNPKHTRLFELRAVTAAPDDDTDNPPSTDDDQPDSDDGAPPPAVDAHQGGEHATATGAVV